MEITTEGGTKRCFLLFVYSGHKEDASRSSRARITLEILFFCFHICHKGHHSLLVLSEDEGGNIGCFEENVACFGEKVRCFGENVACFGENVAYFAPKMGGVTANLGEIGMLHTSILLRTKYLPSL